MHAAQPAVADRRRDGHARVAHPQPWVPVPLHVRVRAAEPADQEQREPVARSAADLAVLPLVQRRQRGLALVHEIVEALDELAHGPLATESLERRAPGAGLGLAHRGAYIVIL